MGRKAVSQAQAPASLQYLHNIYKHCLKTIIIIIVIGTKITIIMDTLFVFVKSLQLTTGIDAWNVNWLCVDLICKVLKVRIEAFVLRYVK